MRTALVVVVLLAVLAVAAASAFEVTKTCTSSDGSAGGIYSRGESSSCSWRVERR